MTLDVPQIGRPIPMMIRAVATKAGLLSYPTDRHWVDWHSLSYPRTVEAGLYVTAQDGTLEGLAA